MRILHIIRSVTPEGGGPIEGVKQLSHVLTGRGHHIEIASLDLPADPVLATCPVPVHAMGRTRARYGFTPPLVPWLRAHRHEFDAVIVNGIWQYHGFAAWRALHGTDTPYFVFTHGMLDPWFKRRYPLKHVKKWLYWLWAEYRVLRDARAVLFTCEEERRLARESFWLYRCRERVVPYGTAEPGGNPAAQRELFLSRWPHLQDKRMLLFLGRIHEKKGCDLLLHAFRQVLEQRGTTACALHLVLAGPEGRGSATLRPLVASLGIESRVTWTGMLTEDIKFGAYHAADAFILPSHQENFGISVAEALACGLPVLISDKVNIWREIQDDGAGFVAPDTIDGTRTLIERWCALADAGQREMRVKALACFRARFDILAAANGLLRTLAEGGVRL